MLRHRVLSAVVALAIVIPVIIRGGIWFMALVALAAGLGVHEFYQMVTHNRHSRAPFIVFSIGWILAAWCLPGRMFESLIPALFMVTAFYVIFIGHLFGKDLAVAGRSLTAIFAGMFYVIFPLLHFVLLREMPNGHLIIGWVLVATFAGDTGAYFVGKAIGRHKLAPRISPGKSWEGFFAQIVFAVLGSILWNQRAALGVDGIRDGIIVGLLCGIFGPLGDLAESLIKRAFGVKDSGNLMPGHGGMLDRIDGLLFAGPVVYYYLRLFGVIV